MHAVNRALYHTGQLGDTMFAWPQERTYLFLTGTDYRWVYWQSFAVHLELGFTNLAENALMECLEGMGDRPMILQQLALIHMVKGNLGTARVYLHVLSTTLFHHTWARRYLQLLERDPELATDATVQHLRSIAMEQDYPSLNLTKERMLLCLLEKNGRNRMAFEYLMGWYLLNRRLNQFVARLDELRDFGYEELPRHFEEAILVYTAAERKPVQLRGFKPRADVLQQMKRFVGIIERYGGNKQAAYAELERHYRSTYAFYNAFGRLEKTK